MTLTRSTREPLRRAIDQATRAQLGRIVDESHKPTTPAVERRRAPGVRVRTVHVPAEWAHEWAS